MNSDRDNGNTRTDEMLMQAYRFGDERAFEELYRRYSAKVYGYLKSRIAPAALADEVFQDTFLRLHRYRDRYDHSLPFVPWLFTICRSALVDRLRKESRQKELENAAALAESQGAGTSAAGGIALEALSPREREALALRYGSDLDFDEIGRRLSTSSVNARQVVSRAVRRLRSLFKGGR